MFTIMVHDGLDADYQESVTATYADAIAELQELAALARGFGFLVSEDPDGITIGQQSDATIIRHYIVATPAV